MDYIIKFIRRNISPEKRDKIRFFFKRLYFFFLFLKEAKLIYLFNNKKNFEKNSNDYKILNLLYIYNKFFGKFENILLIRNLILKLKKKNYSILTLEEKISLDFELNNYEEIIQAFSKEIKHNQNTTIEKKFHILKMFFNCEEVDSIYNNEINSEYAEIIKNKSIAIVGPGDSNENTGNEIESFDIIIRTNHTNEKTLDESKYGSRTNIVYFNDGYWVDHKNQVLNLNKAIWKVFKTKKIYDQFLKIKDENDLNTRVMDLTLDNFSNLNASAHAIPNIVFDIKKFSPKRIKVFNADQYYHGLNYYKSYQDLRKNKIFNIELASKELRLHDPFFGYHLLHNFEKRQIIEMDNFSKVPLSVGEVEFSKKLDHNFKNLTF